MTNLSDLPSSLQRFAAKHPKIWEKYSELGQESSLAGPLDGKIVQLIKVAIYASKRQETPLKTHVRLAIENGAIPRKKSIIPYFRFLQLKDHNSSLELGKLCYRR
ncbi:MAG: hypothetical protein V3U49_04355 [Nitrososphaerales archaeon]